MVTVSKAVANHDQHGSQSPARCFASSARITHQMLVLELSAHCGRCLVFHPQGGLALLTRGTTAADYAEDVLG